MREQTHHYRHTWHLRLIGCAGAALLFAAVLAFLAPFGTYRFEIMERLGYWTFVMAAWLVLSALGFAATFAWPMPGIFGQVPRQVSTVLFATLPMMAVTGIANNMMSGWQPSALDLAELFASIVLIGGAHTYLSARLFDVLLRAGAPEALVGERSSGTHDESALTPSEPIETALLDRLPAHIRVDILCLQVEDHYVRVHSSQGSAMILMRFTDALRGLAHIPGAQVHRSWWVASRAVNGMKRSGRTAQLLLANDLRVPVSQPYLAQATLHWGDLDANQYA